MVLKHGLKRTDYWESSFSQDGKRTAETLLGLLEHLPDGSTELLCHPGTGKAWRKQDYQALLDPRVKKAIEQLDIHLTTYLSLFPDRSST